MSQQRTRVECPLWHSPLLNIIDDGLECRCKSCKAVHTISKEALEQEWLRLKHEDTAGQAHVVREAS